MSSKVQQALPQELPPDPYEALGVPRTADEATIKAAYRKLALKYHPDKNQGNDEAIRKFQEVSQAYSILSDPELKEKYDKGGMQALSQVDLSEVQVDVSQMGFLSTSMFAMASKLGLPVKTVVSDNVHMAVGDKTYKSAPLLWNQPVTGRVANSQAVFYTLDLTAEHIAAGFAITAVCNHCKVKLLMWDRDADGEWATLCQENAQKFGGLNVSSIVCATGNTIENVPKPAMLALREDPIEGGWFHCLDPMAAREHLNIKPGPHLVAVYGDNFFKKSAYNLRAFPLENPKAKQQQEDVDALLFAKRHELHDFEAEFKRVREEFEAVLVRLKQHETELEAIVRAREVAYLDLLNIPHALAGVSLSRPSATASASEGAPSAPGAPQSAGVNEAGEPKAQRTSPLGSMFKAASSNVQRLFSRRTDRDGAGPSSKATTSTNVNTAAEEDNPAEFQEFDVQPAAAAEGEKPSAVPLS